MIFIPQPRLLDQKELAFFSLDNLELGLRAGAVLLGAEIQTHEPRGCGVRSRRSWSAGRRCKSLQRTERRCCWLCFPRGVQQIPQGLTIHFFFLLKLTGVLCFYLQLKSKYQHSHLLIIAICIGSCAEPHRASWDSSHWSHSAVRSTQTPCQFPMQLL